jgi:hypothetical protein
VPATRDRREKSGPLASLTHTVRQVTDRMHGSMRTFLIALLLSTAAAASQQPSTALVELDAVVVDSHDEPIGGLGAADFEVKEDGKIVSIASVSEITPDSPGKAPSLVVLWVAGFVPQRIQYIARLLVSRVTVIGSDVPRVGLFRLGHFDEDMFPGRAEIMGRIDTNALDNLVPSTRVHDDPLMTMKTLAERLRWPEHQRKTLVGIGSINAPVSYYGGRGEWIDAVRALARSNVVVNDIDPAGINQGFTQPGLVEETGGRAIAANDFKLAVDLIWREASHYYLISYQPPAGKKRELHSIAVKVRRSGAHVRTRASRGEE